MQRAPSPSFSPFARLGRKGVLAVSLLALVAAASAMLFACSQTPTSVPVRTFERAQRMDVACLQLYDANPNGLLTAREPLGRPQAECAPVASNLSGADFQNQLFALVTQTARGELAVVDLSAGVLVDQSRAVPGINFVPVGALPTDVATSPDGKMAFVASAETNKPAIYGIPTRRLLGDTEGFPHDPEPATIASWPVCALPQNPGGLTIVPRRAGAAAPTADAGTEAGAGDAGDAGAPAADQPAYDLVVVLPGDRRNSAKILTLDPRPFLRGGLPRRDGQPDYGSDPSVTPGPVLEPGSLADCPVLSAVELSGSTALPAAFAPGPRWDDGVKYVDGGVDLTCNRPAQAARCGTAPCCPSVDPVGDAGVVVAEGGVPVVDAGACEPVHAEDAGTLPLALGPLDPPRLVSVVRDEQMLYIADEEVPFVHVVDMSTPGQPRELPPLLATSLSEPGRAVKIKELAISPPTREYKRFLYAVDQIQGSIIVYDVSDPATMSRTPMRRPHPELNPFQPEDRIVFSSPVVSLVFARHDWPLARVGGNQISNAASGLLCNPNPNLDSNPSADLGYFYRASSTDPVRDIGPRRLRGIYAFATLANGSVSTIDVDDWDSPCRRPTNMGVPTSDIAPPQPSSTGIDPYAAPVAGALTVTDEGFFPMVGPHSLRSDVLLRDDPAAGPQLPRVATQAEARSKGVILSQTSESTPILSPPSFAREVPQVHIDQDWKVTWEGAIPGFEGVVGALDSTDGYASVVLSQPNARFCAKGVEDSAQGTERAQTIARSLASRGASPPDGLRLMTDYVQIADELLPADDGYWGITEGADCWNPGLSTPASRYDACQKTFGAAADENVSRDFPILEAYDDRLVLGRYHTEEVKPASGPDPAVTRRQVVYKDPTNAVVLKMLRCCFHGQARFRVRTGQEWSVVGTTPGGGAGGVGFFSHLTTDTAGRCVPSCEPRESLLNGRLISVPPQFFVGAQGASLPAPTRNSPLGFRNPMMDFFIAGALDGTPTVRDTVYTFSTRGGFRAQAVSIAGGSVSVNPQSMRYIEPLGQIGVVDGASQGLVLIDLRAVAVARAPYF